MPKELDEFPDCQAVKYPERVTVAVSRETFQKIKTLRYNRKNVATVLRDCVENAVNSLEVKKAAG